MNQIASQNAPSSKVVIPHYAFGGLTWLRGNPAYRI